MLKQANKVNELLCAARNNLVDALWLIDDLEEAYEFNEIQKIGDRLQFLINKIKKDGENNGR